MFSKPVWCLISCQYLSKRVLLCFDVELPFAFCCLICLFPRWCFFPLVGIILLRFFFSLSCSPSTIRIAPVKVQERSSTDPMQVPYTSTQIVLDPVQIQYKCSTGIVRFKCRAGSPSPMLAPATPVPASTRPAPARPGPAQPSQPEPGHPKNDPK